MTANPPAIVALVRHMEAIGSTGRGRRCCARWRTAEPRLAGYVTAASVAEAVRAAGPADQDEMAAALLRLAAGDELAQLTLVAGLSRRLGWIVTGWRRAGLDRIELAALEADLVAECWTAVASAARKIGGGEEPPPRPAMTVVQTAWQRVRTSRRRQRRHESRTVPPVEAAESAMPCLPDEDLAAEIVAAWRSGRITVTAARLVFATRVAGWSVAEAADRLGCTPQSVRTRRARAERQLAAA